MIGGFGMKKELMRVCNPQDCSICNRILLTPQDLISNSDTFHSNHTFSTFSSSAAAAAPTTFRHHQNRNPNTGFPAGNRFDLSYYRRGYIDEQGRFHKGFPAITPAITPARDSNFLFGQQERPKLMNLFPAMTSEGFRTLPLLSQLEQRRPQGTVSTEKGGAISSSVDLTLRL